MLPEGIELTDCVRDPHGRMNHIYHAATDQTFHVSPDLFQQVAGPKAPQRAPGPEEKKRAAEAEARQKRQKIDQAAKKQQPKASAHAGDE